MIVNSTHRTGRETKHRQSALFSFVCVCILVAACRGGVAPTAIDGPIEASGLIEGEKVTISSEIGGTVAQVLVEEGDRVYPGDVLVRLDDTLLQAQLAEVQAQVSRTRASRDLIAAGPRPGEITSARAAVAGAGSARDGALQAWHNAIIARNNPQELLGRIAAARTELELTTFQIEGASLALQAAELKRDQMEEGTDDWRAQEAQVRAAAADLAAAEAARDGAQAQLDQLVAIQQQPLVAEVQIRAAAERYDVAVADLRLAEARLYELEAGPSEAEIAVADAMVRQAQAAADILLAQSRLMTLTVPPAGPMLPGQLELVEKEPKFVNMVSAQIARPREAVSPGAPLLILTRLDPLYLMLYIPTDQIGWISLNQSVQVRVDSFPGEVFPAKVAYISPRAEFTPHSLQTYEERVKAVFAVKVRLSNPDGRLKPGMPADALIP